MPYELTATGIPVTDEELFAAASQDLALYTSLMWPQFQLWHHHRRIIEALEDVEAGRNDRLAIFMPPRHGKLCADSTPILTTVGWSTHGALTAGDFVFGPDGKPTRVLAISEPSIADVEVVTTTGAVVKCHRSHEWTVFDRSAQCHRTVETRSFIEPSRWTGEPPKLWSGQPGKRGARVRFQLPAIAACEFGSKELPLDPYALGVWLGDGSASKSQITMTADDLAAVMPGLESAGYPVTARWVHPDTGVPTISLGGRKGRKAAGFVAALRAAGALRNKHIPEVYLRSSMRQRLALLAGLIDTDGHVKQSTGRVRIVTTISALRDGVIDLTSTLGFRPYVGEAAPARTSSGIQGREIVYTIGFQPTMPVPTRVPRRRIERFASQRRVGIAAVRSAAEPETGRCIQVDRSDGLYLVGRELLPTHNSLIASQHFPAWCLGRRPERQIIAMTYGSELARDFGRSVRDQVRDPLFSAVFPGVALAKDSSASNRFKTPQGGAYFAAGRNGSMTGRGAHLFLVDDPVKNMEEADSEIIRRKTIAVYEAVALTRLMKGGAIVLIQTRWHEDDLAGHLLKHHTHDKWRVLELPAIDADGRALWEPMFSIADLRRKQKGMSNRAWSALYQQRPTSDDGAILLRRYWKPWTAPLPERPVMVLFSLDTAYTEKEQNDASALTVWYVVETPYHAAPVGTGQKPAAPDFRVKLLLRYAWRKRVEFPELVETMLDAVSSFSVRGVPFRVLVEAKASGLSVIQELRRRAPSINLHAAPATTSKVARAHSVTAMLEAGRVYALADLERQGDSPDAPDAAVFRPWALETINECASFPVGAHDDLVDSVTHALRHIRDMGVELFAEDAPADAPATQREPLY